jgi:hypothetical protein
VNLDDALNQGSDRPEEVIRISGNQCPEFPEPTGSIRSSPIVVDLFLNPSHLGMGHGQVRVERTDNPDQIFESFVTTKPHGTGMGLSITRSIVESHGGRLWAERNAVTGATFLFTLPGDARE